MLVKHDGQIYRVSLTKSEEEFRKFKDKNKNCEILVFTLQGQHLVVPIKSLEYLADDRHT